MEDFEQHLKSLWQEGGREIAVSFLKRALKPDMSLHELYAALTFDAVRPHLDQINLKDVMAARHASGAALHPAQERVYGRPLKARRKRRTAEELREIGELICKMLLEEPGSLNTVQIVSSLEQSGHTLDTMRVNSLLRTFETDGKVVDLGGKPKAWRASAKMRQSGSI